MILDSLYEQYGQQDVLEALSRKYFPTVHVLKLTSGRYAIFNADRELWKIVDRWDVTAKLMDDVPAPKERKQYVRPPTSGLNLTLEL